MTDSSMFSARQTMSTSLYWRWLHVLMWSMLGCRRIDSSSIPTKFIWLGSQQQLQKIENQIFGTPWRYSSLPGFLPTYHERPQCHDRWSVDHARTCSGESAMHHSISFASFELFGILSKLTSVWCWSMHLYRAGSITVTACSLELVTNWWTGFSLSCARQLIWF